MELFSVQLPIVKKKQVDYSLYDMLTRLCNNIIVYHVMSKRFQ